MTLADYPKKMIRMAALFGFSAVLLGAFGAHGLKSKITVEMLTVFEVGCRYQLAHAIALLVLAGLTPFLEEQTLCWVGRCWVIGIIIFSGSLYVLALTGVRQWGMVTPIGGLLLILGWLLLFLGAGRKQGFGKKN